MHDHENRTLRSRLPQDRAYWDDLAGRILSRSAPQIETWGTQRAPWWSWLADLSPALAAAAILALLGTWVFEPPVPAADPDATLPIVWQAIAPGDPMARALLADSFPPAIAGLSMWTATDGGTP